VLAHTHNTPSAAVADHARKLYGVQFHPEVVHSKGGIALIRNFVYHICKCQPTWTTEAFVEDAIREVRARVGDKRVLLALSGGVDSSTLAFLLHKAIGDQLTCMFIDQGFMRKDEPERLVKLFAEQFHIPVIHVKARDRFLAQVEGVTDPEVNASASATSSSASLKKSRSASAPSTTWPRDAVSRRHRVGRHQRRPQNRRAGSGEDQEPPQRRRSAQRPAIQAGRTPTQAF
jgi:hypothetical protein